MTTAALPPDPIDDPATDDTTATPATADPGDPDDNEISAKAAFVRECLKADESDRRMVRTIVEFLHPSVIVNDSSGGRPLALSRETTEEDDDETRSARELARTAAYRRARRIFDADLQCPEMQAVRDEARHLAAGLPGLEEEE